MAWRSTHFHFLLLCLFFVFHGFNENYPFVTPVVAGILLLNEFIAAIILFALSLAVFRSSALAAVFTFILLSVNFFFGAFQDALKSVQWLKPLSSYRVLLSSIIILLVTSFILLRRRNTNTLARLNKYLMVMMLVFTGIEVFSLIRHVANASSVNNAPENNSAQQTNSERPDIYFILFDSYAGNRALKEICHFDNSPTENMLRSKGFYLPSYSFSNYNFTAFSMASILNMKYLDGIKNPGACDVNDYSHAEEAIKNNAVASYLQTKGYEIINHSVFDLKGHPSPVNQTYLPLGARLISDQTLLNRIKRDLKYLLVQGNLGLGWLQDDIYATLRNNEKLVRLTSQIATEQSIRPRFIYTHLYMPHLPFYHDEKGKLRNVKAIIEDEQQVSVTGYINNLRVTNDTLMALVNTIMKGSSNKAVIVLAGDHGFRPRKRDELADQQLVFNNFYAVYIPGGHYEQYRDSVSSVNLFPVLFNTVFKAGLPILKDSTTYLTDKPAIP